MGISPRGLSLGIDAGGTYTDAVLYESGANQVISKSKALTTHADLSKGIGHALEALHGLQPGEVKLVCLSTTLATNAIVEGKGGRVGVMLIGYDREIMQRQGLKNRLPAEGIFYIRGGHNVKGEEVCPFDEEEATQAVRSLRERVDAFAVSGYFSVMNPDHEQRARQIITHESGLPVVCGHELSSKLDALRRATTAVLNARLLPLIQPLLDSVKGILQARGITAPLMILKGDGSLTSQAFARLHPVETILSGPAASAVGAWQLSGLETAIVVDIGGTTTDIAVLNNGLPWINPAGATVGGWQTNVQAVDLHTIGIGGDSHIRIEGRDLRIGPRRAVPLCQLEAAWPDSVNELESIYFNPPAEWESNATDFLIVEHLPDRIALDDDEQALLSALTPEPHSIHRLHKAMEHSSLPIERLERLGILRRAGLTPTDIFWPEVHVPQACSRASHLGAEIIARHLGLSLNELPQQILEYISSVITREILDKLAKDATGNPLFPATPAWEYLLEQTLRRHRASDLILSFSVARPIVAIGAPVAAFIPHVAENLHTHYIIPEHAEVGNAVGVAVANIHRTIEVLVQPFVQGSGTVKYLVHSPEGREEHPTFDESVCRAESLAAELARKALYQAGARSVSVKIDRKEIVMGALSEVTIRANATGFPQP